MTITGIGDHIARLLWGFMLLLIFGALGALIFGVTREYGVIGLGACLAVGTAAYGLGWAFYKGLGL